MDHLTDRIPAMPIIMATILLLVVLSMLTIGGVSESAEVAIGIFILSAFIIVFLLSNGLELFIEN